VALASAFWVLRSAYFLVETVPVGAVLWLDLLYYVASGGFAVVITLVLLRLAGRTGARAAWMRRCTRPSARRCSSPPAATRRRTSTCYGCRD